MVEEQKSPPGPSGATSTINLEEVDNLLNELDPEFRNILGDLTSQMGTITSAAGLESVTLSADYLKDSAEAKSEDVLSVPAAEPPKGLSEPSTTKAGFFSVWVDLAVSSLNLALCLFRISVETFRDARRTSFGEALKKLPTNLNTPLTEWVSSVRKVFSKLRSYSFTTYMKLGFIIFLLFSIRYVLIDMKNHIRPDGTRDPFLRNWEEVSDSVHNIPADELDETVENPLRHPEYTVLIHRIVSNLKSSTPKRTPMVTSELYIEASNQDCAIELHDRELEVRDALERVFEDTTFDDLDTTPGKERLKIKIRTSLNRFLTKGHVKRIFFSALNMVP